MFSDLLISQLKSNIKCVCQQRKAKWNKVSSLFLRQCNAGKLSDFLKLTVLRQSLIESSSCKMYPCHVMFGNLPLSLQFFFKQNHFLSSFYLDKICFNPNQKNNLDDEKWDRVEKLLLTRRKSEKTCRPASESRSIAVKFCGSCKTEYDPASDRN